MDPANTTRPAPLARLSVPAKHRPCPYRRSPQDREGPTSCAVHNPQKPTRSHCGMRNPAEALAASLLRDALSCGSTGSEFIVRCAILREHQWRLHCAARNPARAPASTPLHVAQSRRSTRSESIARRAIQREH